RSTIDRVPEPQYRMARCELEAATVVPHGHDVVLKAGHIRLDLSRIAVGSIHGGVVERHVGKDRGPVQPRRPDRGYRTRVESVPFIRWRGGSLSSAAAASAPRGTPAVIPAPPRPPPVPLPPHPPG